jgi:hypothetical protein
VFVMLEMDHTTTFDMGASLELHGRAAHVERAKAWCLLTHGDQGESLVPPCTRGPGRKPGASLHTGTRAKAWCLLTHGDQGESRVPPYTRGPGRKHGASLYTGKRLLSLRLKGLEAGVESSWFQRLKPNCDKLLSRFSFKCSLRQYSAARGT